MQTHEIIILKRECQAIEIPTGKSVVLYPGTELRLIQALGGSFTVATYQGTMASIAGRDADAIGKEVPREIQAIEENKEGKTAEELVWEHLRTCYDPEIPHSIVDLGLIYDCKVSELSEGSGDLKVDVLMTLTAPGCGMGDWIVQDVRNKLLTVPHVKEVHIQMTFDPPWTPERMHPALRRSLNF